MCKHEYQIPNFKADSNICYLPKIFAEHNILGTEIPFKLPHDDMDMCLFHSNQRAFKEKFDLPKVLDRFIDYCNEHKFELIDLRGIILDIADPISLEGKTILREINLCKAKITAPFSIVNCHLHGDVFLDQAIFTNILSIEDSTFSGNFTATGGTVFNKNVHLSNVQFADLFDISHSNFMSQVNFHPVTFNGRTIFDNVAFRGQRSFIYFKLTSRDTIEFNQTIFDGQVQFENCVFDGDVIFQDTKFNDPLYFANPDIGGTVRGMSNVRTESAAKELVI